MKNFRSSHHFLAPLIGNLLEWYEFAIFGFYVFDISQAIFKEENHFMGVIKTFSIFALGFFMRPIGAATLGHFADKIGRKKILFLSILLMSIATLFMSVIPSYQTIGISSGMILLFLRIIQGFALGGEHASSLAYIIEQSPPNLKGFFGSLTLFSSYLGILLGSVTGTIISYIFKDSAIAQDSWRIAFFLGALVGFYGLYIRDKMSESSAFTRLQHEKKILKSPLRYILKKKLHILIQTTGLTVAPASCCWMILSYFPFYIKNNTALKEYQTLSIESMTIICLLLVIPLVGLFYNKINKFALLLSSYMLIFIVTIPVFHGLLSSSMTYIFLAQLSLGLAYILSESLLPALLTSLYDTEHRCTGLALSFNFAYVIFGGTSPLISTFLIQKTHNILSPSWYLMLMALISTITLLAIKWKNKKAFA
jgi:MHS family proline/betaine transporter-like MFS transporter